MTAAKLWKGKGAGWLLLFFFLLALAIRLIYWRTVPPVLNGEEAEYARIAENLFAGRGYSGVYGGPQLMHAPLFSLLAAGGLALLPDAQSAGTAVSLLAGAALAPLLFLIGQEVNGRRTAILAGALAAVTPALVHLSTAVLSEALTLSLIAAAVWATIRLMRTGRARFALSMGLLWGLTYLARPTGAILLLVSLACFGPIAYLLGQSPRRIAGQALLVVALFTLTALPYIAFTRSVSGTIALEYKSRYLNALLERRLVGMTPAEAGLGIDEQLNPQGPQLDQTAFILSAPRGASGGLGTLIEGLKLLGADNLRRHWRLTAAALTLPLLVLAGLGLFGPPYEKRRLLLNGYLALLALAILFSQLSVPQFVARFVAPLLPLALLFAAQGADFLAGLLAGLLQRRSGGSFALPLTILAVGILALLLIVGGQALAPSPTAVDQLRSKKTAGLWLLEQYGPEKVIMDDGPLIPYYAGGQLSPLPYAGQEDALAYIARQQPDFIILSGYNRKALPYLEGWMAEGIPEGQARLVYDRPTLDGQSIQIYRWN